MTNQKVSTRSSSLRIAVIGVGGIGSTFAFQLTQQGAHEVTAVARPGSMRLQQLQRDGGVVNKRGELAPLLVTDTLDESIPYDLVLVTLQAHQVDAVLPGLQRSAAKRIQFMFNNFDPERLQDAIGVNRCSFGMPFVQALLDKDGRLNAKIGAGGQKTKMNHQASVETFNAAGLPAVFEPDMLLWLRCHAPLGAAFESVCAAGMQRGGGASWNESLAIARGMQECFTMIERLGFRLYPVGKIRLHSSPAWLVAAMFWGMSRITPFRELLATGVNECRALVDVLVENATRANPPVSIDRIRAMRPASKRSP
ncbi:ketopantoate reductase family protein [Rhodanobacter sp. BL-MT-08]